MAIVIAPFRGVPDGLTQPKDFEIGETVEGKLADIAITEGWAVSETDESPPIIIVIRIPVPAIVRQIFARVSAFIRQLRPAN
jgi:hypothetical protein